MRHPWACDIADFAKYGLLKQLAGSDLRVGVLWYLTNHAVSKPPLLAYLSRPNKYRDYDSALFDALRRLRADKGADLTLADIEQGDVLPSNTIFHAAPLSTRAVDQSLRLAARERWFEGGCAATRECDLVFLDPDTGILPTGRKPENVGGDEFATVEEVVSLVRRGQSVVCVQFGRPGNLEPEPELARQRLAALNDALTANGLPAPWGLWWRDTHKVALIIASSTKHADSLLARTEQILASRHWSASVSAL
jgi:hypothetical protein